jgi:glutamate transport system permease protein
VAVIFILLNYGLTILAGRVERRLNRRGRGPRKGGKAAGVVGAGAGGVDIEAGDVGGR